MVRDVATVWPSGLLMPSGVGLSVGVSAVRGARCGLYQREGVVCYKEGRLKLC